MAEVVVVTGPNSKEKTFSFTCINVKHLKYVLYHLLMLIQLLFAACGFTIEILLVRFLILMPAKCCNFN